MRRKFSSIDSKGSHHGPYNHAHHEDIRVCGSPVDINYLADTADCLISYGAETTVAFFLSRGVPQLLIPDLVEGLLTSYRISEQGAGKVLHNLPTDEAIRLALREVVGTQTFAQGALDVSDTITFIKLPHSLNHFGEGINCLAAQ